MVDLVTLLAKDHLQGPVLEIGSFLEEDQHDLDLRVAFPGQQFVGTDVSAGHGVDVVADLLDVERMTSVAEVIRPRTILCLYVLEHVWQIQQAAATLGILAQAHPEASIIVATHQNQPYHGHPPYEDYWRVTYAGMRRLMAVSGMHRGEVMVCSDTSNPEDVLYIQGPVSAPIDKQVLVDIGAKVSKKWEVA